MKTGPEGKEPEYKQSAYNWLQADDDVFDDAVKAMSFSRQCDREEREQRREEL